MELSEIREKIDAVDEQLLDLFLQRMDLSDEVAAYKNAHHLPILNKERERAILAKVTEKSGERERYAYHLFSTLFELARSRQAELISAPTKVAAQVRASLEAGTSVFPQTGLVACQGVEGANSQVACDRLLPRGNIVYVKTFQAVVSAVESGLCRFGVLPGVSIIQSAGRRGRSGFALSGAGRPAQSTGPDCPDSQASRARHSHTGFFRSCKAAGYRTVTIHRFQRLS